MKVLLASILLVVLGQFHVFSQRLVTTWTETEPRCVYSADRTHVIITDQSRNQTGLTVLDRTRDTFWLLSAGAEAESSLGRIVSIAPHVDGIFFADVINNRTVLSTYSMSSNAVTHRDTLDSVNSVHALKDGAALLLSQRINGENRLLYKDGPYADVDTICMVPYLVLTDGLSERFYSVGNDDRITVWNATTCDTVLSFAFSGDLSTLTLRPISIDRVRGLIYIAMDRGTLLCYDEVNGTLKEIFKVSTRIVSIDVDQRNGHVVVTTPDSIFVRRDSETFYTLAMKSDLLFDSFQDAIFDLDGDRLLVANSLYSEWVDLDGIMPSTIASIAATPFSVFRHRDQVLVLGSDSRTFSIDVRGQRLTECQILNALQLTFNTSCGEFVRFRDSRLLFYDYSLRVTDTVAVSNHNSAECLAFTCDKSAALFYGANVVCIHDLQTDSCLLSLDCSQLGTIRTGEIDEANERVIVTGTEGGLIVNQLSSSPESVFHPLLRTKSLDRGRRVLPNHCNSVNDIVVTMSSLRSIAISRSPYGTVNMIYLQDPTAWIVGVFYAQNGGILYVADNSSRYWCVDLENNTMSVVDSTTLRGTLTTLDRETMSGVNTVSFAQHCLADFSSGCILSHIDDSPAATVSPSGLSLDYDGHNLVVSDLHGREIRSVKVFDYSGRLLACSSTTAPNIVSFAVDMPALPMFASVTGIDWHEVSRLPTIIR